MKIGELAKAAKTQVETIRYYEREGLLTVTLTGVMKRAGRRKIEGPSSMVVIEIGPLGS